MTGKRHAPPMWKSLRKGASRVRLDYSPQGSWVNLVALNTRVREAPAAIELELELDKNLRSRGFEDDARAFVEDGASTLSTIQISDDLIVNELERWLQADPERAAKGKRFWLVRLLIQGGREYLAKPDFVAGSIFLEVKRTSSSPAPSPRAPRRGS